MDARQSGPCLLLLSKAASSSQSSLDSSECHPPDSRPSVPTSNLARRAYGQSVCGIPSHMASYTPSPEETEILQAIPRDFLKYCAAGFAAGSVSTHLILRATLKNAVKNSFALRYGAPVGIGLLSGVVLGVNRIRTLIDHLVFDLPNSPLTSVYRAKLYVFCAAFWTTFVRYKSEETTPTTLKEENK